MGMVGNKVKLKDGYIGVILDKIRVHVSFTHHSVNYTGYLLELNDSKTRVIEPSEISEIVKKY